MFDLTKIGGVSAGVLGDLALDIYWYADMKQSELSRETPHYPLPVVREVISLGAGGNVAENLAALGPKSLAVCGVCGDDWRGAILRQKLAGRGMDPSGMVVEPERFTQTYCKPMRMGISDLVYEDPRIDFASSEAPSAESEAKILGWLDEIDGKLDVLCVCDQFRTGSVTKAVRERLSRMRTPVVVDSRYHIGEYRVKGVLKPNEDECRAALTAAGIEVPDDPADLARALVRLTGACVLLTLGEDGSLFLSPDALEHGEEPIVTPAVRADGPIDICGAGDTTLAAFALCTAAGASPAEAAWAAALASSVTIRKIGMTGTASREEIARLDSQPERNTGRS